MTIKQQLDQDLKAAMLAGNKDLVTTLRGLKSVILYAEVAAGNRDQGLDDEAVVSLFSKEAKKRQESADLYVKGGAPGKADAELEEKRIIERYLPQQMTDDELHAVVDAVIAEQNASGMQAMGAVIAAVKTKVGSQADGGRIAQVVKGKL